MFVIFCRSIIFCLVYMHGIVLSESTGRPTELGKANLDWKSKVSPQMQFTDEERVSSTTTLGLGENQKTLFYLYQNSITCTVRDEVICCCNVIENQGPREKQAVILYLKEQRMPKLIHDYVRAGEEWEVQANPLARSTLPQPKEPRNAKVSIYYKSL